MARQQPESKLTNKIRVNLTSKLGGHWFKIHGGRFQSGIPDLLGCCEGLFFALEVKVPGNKPTELQKKFLEHIDDNGGYSTVVYSVEEAEDFVRECLELSPK